MQRPTRALPPDDERARSVAQMWSCTQASQRPRVERQISGRSEGCNMALVTVIAAINMTVALLMLAAYPWMVLRLRRGRCFELQASAVSVWRDEGRRHQKAEPYVVCVRNYGEIPVSTCDV